MSFKRASSLLFFLLLSLTALQAQIKITGTVTDETKETVIGANITVKGTTIGTISDINGKYSIEVPNQKAILVFSFIGYTTREIPVGKNKVINVVMKEDGVMLNEVVAIGYGSAKKGDLAGSVAKVDMEELNKTPVASFDQALGGRVAGVQVVSGDGRPGSAANIVIRGSNTVSDNSDGSPLYVIDGFATDDPNAAAYNPSDIESMDILKDASATAIYGARGANGVIIITTKRGKESAPRVTYDGYFTWQEQPQFLDIMNGKQFMKLQTEMLTEKELNDTYFGYSEALGRKRTLADYDYIPYYNWQDEVYRGAPMTSHNVSLSGGSKNTRYSSSISYYNQQGVIINSSYESLKARLTLDQNISKSVKFGATMNFANNLSKGSAPSQSGGGTSQYYLYQVLAYRPVTYNEKDDLINNMVDESGNYPYNPMKTVQNSYDQTRTRQLNLNTYLTWDIIKNLTFKATFNYTWRQDVRRTFYNSDTYQGDPSASGVNGNFSDKDRNSWSNEYTLNYKRRFGDHNLAGLLGASLSSDRTTVMGAGSGLITWESLGFWGLDSGTPRSITTTSVESKLMSYFARFNYDWKSRYILIATIRADGSSRFPYNKWGYFPAFSAAWRLGEEEFIKDLNIFSDLKFRIGYGLAGNNRIGSYSSLAIMSSVTYPNGNSAQSGYASKQVPNPDLKWEANKTFNVGLDFGFFDQRLTISPEFYINRSSNLLFDARLPNSSGYSSMTINAGETENKGIDLTINSVNITNKNFSWNTTVTLSHNKNSVKQLTGEKVQLYLADMGVKGAGSSHKIGVGEPLGQFYGYISDGLYQVSDFDYDAASGKYTLKDGIPYRGEKNKVQPGMLKFKNIDGSEDNKITEDDKTVIGNAFPKFYGGINNTFTYKDFDLSIFLTYSFGNDVLNATKLTNTRTALTNKNVLAAADWSHRWVTINKETGDLITNPEELAAINQGKTIACFDDNGSSDNAVIHSWAVEDGSYLKLSNITLGYTFPKKIINKIGLSKLRLYATGNNLLTWTKYTGFDPEVSTMSDAMTPGVDFGAYPRSRSFVFGINVAF